MTDIYYPIARIPQQEEADCVQACAAQILSHFGTKKSVSEIKAEVPVFVDSHGTKLGTSIGHVAVYFLSLGFEVTLHTSDVVLFDTTWKQLSKQELVARLQDRAANLTHAIYGRDAIQAITDGFVQFLQRGGMLVQAVVDEKYLVQLLTEGPVYAVVNYQFLYDKPKYRFVGDTLEDDPVRGDPSTHAVLITGYKNGLFCLLDPNAEFQVAEQWVAASKLIASYYLADVNLDPILITLRALSA